MPYGPSELDEEKPLFPKRYYLVSVLGNAFYSAAELGYKVCNTFKRFLTREDTAVQTQTFNAGLERIVEPGVSDNSPDAISLGMPLSLGCGGTHAPRRSNRAILIANIVVGLDGPKVVEGKVSVGEEDS